MNYSIQYKNGRGITARSEFLPFETDAAAIEYGRDSSSGNASVEVWKGDNLVTRLFGAESSEVRPS